MSLGQSGAERSPVQGRGPPRGEGWALTKARPCPLEIYLFCDSQRKKALGRMILCILEKSLVVLTCIQGEKKRNKRC